MAGAGETGRSDSALEAAHYSGIDYQLRYAHFSLRGPAVRVSVVAASWQLSRPAILRHEGRGKRCGGGVGLRDTALTAGHGTPTGTPLACFDLWGVILQPLPQGFPAGKLVGLRNDYVDVPIHVLTSYHC